MENVEKHRVTAVFRRPSIAALAAGMLIAPSSEFTPAYEEKQLQVGECNTGWIAVGHGNPDLAWASVRYQPADFGDVITWDLSGS